MVGVNFSSSPVWMCYLDHKEGWVPKNWCFQIMVLEKTLKSPLDCKEIKPVNPEGNWPQIFIGRTVVEAEASILWLPDARANSVENTPILRKTEGKSSSSRQRMWWLDSITNSMNTNLSKLWEILENRGAWHAPVHGVTKSWTQFSNWLITTINPVMLIII